MTVDFKEYSRRMDKALEHLDEEFASVRAGRANAKVLDRITVEYYGSETPLNGVATIYPDYSALGHQAAQGHSEGHPDLRSGHQPPERRPRHPSGVPPAHRGAP